MINTSLLFSDYRRRVLGLLLLHPENRYHVREIARLTSTTAGTLHRELSKLAKAEILTREISGNQVYYQANRSFPIFQELTSILKKTTGLVDVLMDMSLFSCGPCSMSKTLDIEGNELEKKHQINPEQSELGQVSSYDPHYNPERLFVIPRAIKRTEIGVDPNQLPFYGFDCWNHYEVSWLNEKGKPNVAVAEIIYDCATPYLVESKSLKLYFNSFNNTPFKSIDEVRQTVERDLSKCLHGDVLARILPLREQELSNIQSAFTGECIDDLDVTCSKYLVEPRYLAIEENMVDEILYSDLLKSNCLVTNQPDWGSVQIAYKGNKINREGLLKYLVSFRNHNEFHEQCIERIFVDIMNRCKPQELSVCGRYTRRGGLDINPYRSTSNVKPQELNHRLVRQ